MREAISEGYKAAMKARDQRRTATLRSINAAINSLLESSPGVPAFDTAQELLAKVRGVTLDVAVHFIGQLQTNKVRQIAGIVAVYETVDRPALITEIAKRAPGAHVLIQIDTSDEPGKGGCPPTDAERLVTQAAEAGLVVDGLMTVGPTEGGPEAARPGFRLVRLMCDDLGLTTCSMGMTDDFVVAVQEGSTRVRLGSALFGMRPARTP